MKKVIFFGMIISLVIVSCAQEEKSPIEGTWQLVYGKWVGYDKTFPAQVPGEQIKIWTREHFAFVGQLKLDTLLQDNFGGGPYKLEGNRCEFIRQFHGDKSQLGTTGRCLIEVRNDTLIQTWPADENWNLPEKYSIEKYVRLD